MSVWTNPKLQNLSKLPQILAGPILRRVTSTSVTVWLALLEPQDTRQRLEVTLRVFEASGPGDPGTSIIEGQAHASPIGKHVYAVAVTARVKPSGASLKSNTLYQYDLELSPGGKLSDPTTNLLVYGGASLKGRLAYGDFELPTFCLPSPDWRQLHLLHGSCRKPHAAGLDGLLAVDNLLFNYPTLPERPQIMFHTGDQIYADDVSHTLLTMLRVTGKILFFDEEKGISTQFDGIDSSREPFRPGYRHKTVKAAHFTSNENVCNSHLFFLPEFIGMYLFVWSDVLWPDEQYWPSFKDIYPLEDEFYTVARDGTFAKNYTPLASRLQMMNSNLKVFFSSLPKVRRVLANIPNYMVFDDHEITDDWYITKGWCEEVLAASSFGRRVVRNGLLSYAICQAWGNTPEQFNAGMPGGTLLQSVAPPWQGEDKPEIDSSLGIPPPEVWDSGETIPQFSNASAGKSLKYYYQLDMGNYQILILDTRNWRAFPESVLGENNWTPASLLSDNAFDLQITNTLPSNAAAIELTIVISAAVPIGIPIVESHQEDHSKVNVLENDVEGWKGQPGAFESLIGRLVGRVAPHQSMRSVQKILLLSGDVHHGYAVRMDYDGTPYHAITKTLNVPVPAVLAMFTSSALKNQDGKTRLGQMVGYHRPLWIKSISNRMPPQVYAGWSNRITKIIGTRQIDTTTTPVHGPGKVPSIVRLTEDYGGKALILTADAKPDWLYRYEYIDQNIFTLNERVKVLPINSTGDSRKDYTESLGNHAAYARGSKYRDVVGTNNLGEITFGTIEGKIAAIQRLWWTGDVKKPFAISTPYYITLTFGSINAPT